MKHQTACKPGSVRLLQGGTTIPLGRISRCASRDQPGQRDRNVPAIDADESPTPSRLSLFGLAPDGVCHAVPVARDAGRSYRSVSPLPAGLDGLRQLSCAGGLFSVALSRGSPPPAVSRHRVPVEPGLSSVARTQRPSSRLTSLILRGLAGAVKRKATLRVLADGSLHLASCKVPLSCVGRRKRRLASETWKNLPPRIKTQAKKRAGLT